MVISKALLRLLDKGSELFRMLHASDVEIGSVLKQLAKLVSPFTRIHQVVKAASVLSERSDVLLWLVTHIRHEIRKGTFLPLQWMIMPLCRR